MANQLRVFQKVANKLLRHHLALLLVLSTDVKRLGSRSRHVWARVRTLVMKMSQLPTAGRLAGLTLDWVPVATGDRCANCRNGGEALKLVRGMPSKQ